MRELTGMTGLDRQTIHFYIHEGLLPEGDKTGRNTALYGDQHLERIALIRKLQHERFLPLRAIRAILDDDARSFEPAQQKLLHEVKARLHPAGSAANARDEALVLARPLLTKHGFAEEDLLELGEAGVIGVAKKNGKVFVRRGDLWQIELFGALQRAGLSKELGFGPADLHLYVDAVDRLLAAERRIMLERLGHLGADVIAGIVDRALPLIADMLGRYHTARAPRVFESLETPAPERSPVSRAKARPRPRPARRKHHAE